MHSGIDVKKTFLLFFISTLKNFLQRFLINKKRWSTIPEFPPLTICSYKKRVSFQFKQNNG